jgi:hypothetical protein
MIQVIVTEANSFGIPTNSSHSTIPIPLHQ